MIPTSTPTPAPTALVSTAPGMIAPVAHARTITLAMPFNHLPQPPQFIAKVLG